MAWANPVVSGTLTLLVPRALPAADTKANMVPFPLLLSKQAQPRLSGHSGTVGPGQAAARTDAGLHKHSLTGRPDAVLSPLLTSSSPFLLGNN